MKLSIKNLFKIMDICTKKEIDFIIYTAQFQDFRGVVRGIDYKEVMAKICICKSAFYKIVKSLEEKEIIIVNYFNDYGYWEFTINDNVFENKSDYKKGYLKLNYSILHSDAFLNMTKAEKIIVLHLLYINGFKKHKIKVTFSKLREWTGKSLRSVKKFIVTLSRCFHISVDDGLCEFDCLYGFDERKEAETDIANVHLIGYRLKKFKRSAEPNDIKDTNTVIKQYKIKDSNKIIELLDKVINNFGTLAPKYFNKIASASV